MATCGVGGVTNATKFVLKFILYLRLMLCILTPSRIPNTLLVAYGGRKVQPGARRSDKS